MTHVFIAAQHSNAGPASSQHGPGIGGHGIVPFTKQTLTFLMSAPLLVAGIPEFGLLANASMALATIKGSQSQNTKEDA